jgi:hypothetical protein
MNNMDYRRARLLLPPLALLAAASLAWGARHAWIDSADLEKRAVEVRRVVERDDPYASPDMTYPPTAPAVFVPLIAPIDGRWLRPAWLGLNLLAFVAVCGLILRLWARDWPAWLRWTFCLVAAASKPVHLGIGLGQFHLVPLALLLGGLYLIEARRPVVAGLLVGASLVKPTMSLPWLAMLAARRQWRTLVVAAGFQGAALAGVSAWLGRSPPMLIREWLARARTQGASGLIDVPSVLGRLGVDAISVPAVSLGVLLLGSAAIVAARRRSSLAPAALCGFVAAIFTYHRPYDLVLLLPALAYFLDEARRREPDRLGPRWVAAIVFGLMLVAPNNPAIVGRWVEAAYDPVFIATSYAMLAALLLDVIDNRGRPL